MLIQHQSFRLVQSQPLLVLPGTYLGQMAKVMMKGRRAHLHAGSEFFNAERFGIVQFQPFDGFCDAMPLAVDRYNLTQERSLITCQ